MTRRMVFLIAGVLTLGVCLDAGQRGSQGPPPGGGFPGPGGFRGPGMREEQKIVALFDKNGDKWLNAAERKAAREWLSTQGFRGGFGRRGGRGFFGTPQPGPRLSPADIRTIPTSPLYDLGTLRTIFLQFEEPDWEAELEAFYNTDVDVTATATVDGKVYTDVGVKSRGNSSYMMVPTGFKRSLKLSFDLVHHDQTLGGYQTLHLLNANADPTFARVVLYSLIGHDYIPMPKANAMRVAIDGESWGIYVNTQAFNKDFLKEWFEDVNGPRWKVPGSPGARSGGLTYAGDNPEVYKRSYEIKTKDDAKAWADLIQLARVLNETPEEKLEAALAPILDVDGVLKFLALDVVFVNGDGYWTRGSDYNIYEDKHGRFHIIPHDFNEGFGAEEGRGGFGGGGVDLDPLVGSSDTSKPLRSRLLALPALRARYLGYVHDIALRGLDWRKLGPVVSKYEARIAPDVQSDTRKLYSFEAFQTGVGDATSDQRTLRGFIEGRRAFLLKSVK
jgi:CotH kinase protein